MYAYLIDIVLLSIVWLILYFRRKDLRKKILFASLLAMLFGITDALFIPSYWRPEVILKVPLLNGYISFESFAFCFITGGITAALYEEIFHKRLFHIRRKRETPKHHLALFILMIILPFLITSILFTKHIIYLALFWMIMGTLMIIHKRKDLAPEAMWGGILFAAIYLSAFEILAIVGQILQPDWITQTWNLQNMSGIFIGNIPLEEVLYALSFGALWAPLYEYVYNDTLHRPKKTS